MTFPTRRQELPLSGGNGNPTSGYEANERCAADHAMRPAAHRVDHMSISATPDMINGRGPVTHSCSALSQCLHASRSACFFFFCQYIFYKDGQIANRSKCEGFSLGQWE